MTLVNGYAPDTVGVTIIYFALNYGSSLILYINFSRFVNTFIRAILGMTPAIDMFE